MFCKKIRFKFKNLWLIIRVLNLSKIFNLGLWFSAKLMKPAGNFCRPISVDVEPTINCNLNCPFCHNKELSRSKRSLTLADFQKIINDFPSAVRVNIQGMGEPLLNPEIVEMVACAKRQKKFVTLTTNGTLLTEKIFQRLSGAGLDRLIISLDAAERNLYEKLRPGADFDQVVKNIGNAVKSRGNRPWPLINLWSLATRESIVQLNDLVALAGDLKVDSLGLQINLTDWGKGAWREKIKRLRLGESGAAIDSAAKRASQEDLLFFVNNRYTQFKKNRQEICRWPWGGAYIATDGSVVPCCLVADPRVAALGNIFETPFSKIWQGRAYQSLRKKMKSGNYPEYCKQCYEDNPSK